MTARTRVAHPTSGAVLVIKTARGSVLRDYLARNGDDRPHSVLAHPGEAGEGVEAIDAAPGPIRWRRLDETSRVRLNTTHWSEVVVLHNLGDDSYRDLYFMAARVAPTARLRIFYADGEERVYVSTLTFVAGRILLSGVASALLPLLFAAAAPFAAARGLRALRHTLTKR